MYTVALDPSINSAGVALFKDSRLVACTTIRSKTKERNLDEMVRCVLVAHACTLWLKSVLPRGMILSSGSFGIACEWPQVYTVEKSKVPPKALIPMAGVSSSLLTLLWHEGCENTSVGYTPGTWVQGTKKTDSPDIFKTSRALRILSRLEDSPEELQVWKEQVLTHDAIDAVGIGLYHLGRLKQRRIYLGST